jgi:hypothetical protein
MLKGLYINVGGIVQMLGQVRSVTVTSFAKWWKADKEDDA